MIPQDLTHTAPNILLNIQVTILLNLCDDGGITY